MTEAELRAIVNAACQDAFNEGMQAGLTSETVDVLVSCLQHIANWIDAYPDRVFPPLKDEDYPKIHKALADAGYSSERLHAAWARHILGTIQPEVSAALTVYNTAVRSQDNAKESGSAT